VSFGILFFAFAGKFSHSMQVFIAEYSKMCSSIKEIILAEANIYSTDIIQILSRPRVLNLGEAQGNFGMLGTILIQ